MSGAIPKSHPPKLPVVIVEWLDAVDWESPIALSEVATRHRPETVQSIGWLLKEDEIGVQIGCEYYDEMYRRTEFIPRVNIISVTPFSLSRKRTPKPKCESESVIPL